MIRNAPQSPQDGPGASEGPFWYQDASQPSGPCQSQPGSHPLCKAIDISITANEAGDIDRDALTATRSTAGDDVLTRLQDGWHVRARRTGDQATSVHVGDLWHAYSEAADLADDGQVYRWDR